jgi:hypothetical protein
MPIETLTSYQERMLERWSAAWLHSARDRTPADPRRYVCASNNRAESGRRRLPRMFLVCWACGATIIRMLGAQVGTGADGRHGHARGGRLTALLPCDPDAE